MSVKSVGSWFWSNLLETSLTGDLGGTFLNVFRSLSLYSLTAARNLGPRYFSNRPINAKRKDGRSASTMLPSSYMTIKLRVRRSALEEGGWIRRQHCCCSSNKLLQSFSTQPSPVGMVNSWYLLHQRLCFPRWQLHHFFSKWRIDETTTAAMNRITESNTNTVRFDWERPRGSTHACSLDETDISCFTYSRVLSPCNHISSQSIDPFRFWAIHFLTPFCSIIIIWCDVFQIQSKPPTTEEQLMDEQSDDDSEELKALLAEWQVRVLLLKARADEAEALADESEEAASHRWIGAWTLIWKEVWSCMHNDQYHFLLSSLFDTHCFLVQMNNKPTEWKSFARHFKRKLKSNEQRGSHSEKVIDLLVDGEKSSPWCNRPNFY